MRLVTEDDCSGADNPYASMNQRNLNRYMTVDHNSGSSPDINYNKGGLFKIDNNRFNTEQRTIDATPSGSGLNRRTNSLDFGLHNPGGGGLQDSVHASNVPSPTHNASFNKLGTQPLR